MQVIDSKKKKKKKATFLGVKKYREMYMIEEFK